MWLLVGRCQHILHLHDISVFACNAHKNISPPMQVCATVASVQINAALHMTTSSLSQRYMVCHTP